MNLSGTFVSGEHPTEGTVRIVVESEQRFVELQPDFKTSDLGPDLRVVLHRLEDVIGSTTPPDFPIKEQELFLLDRLQSFTGKQRYPIPSWLDLANYQSVVIWCYAFNATFGAAKLNGQ
ncbi:DM13 domain-containing protein [Nostoc sp. NZL]|uniref:DM13 domain-containing protein n=1 Tax=Nostoc sp. NZL TaxID=2650612 RepID=UPI0018C814F4|nr:DM13 domain-containing protein [Nostoc sp. NZL]MBG1245098.1 DM13 domain-containing protein [Nostoc sp. NZL]